MDTSVRHTDELPEQLMSPSDLARYLQVPIETIRKWRSTGVAPAGMKVGRHLRFDRRDVETWLDARRDAA
jgi:excisionase family DNA binding protein